MPEPAPPPPCATCRFWEPEISRANQPVAPCRIALRWRMERSRRFRGDTCDTGRHEPYRPPQMNSKKVTSPDPEPITLHLVLTRHWYDETTKAQDPKRIEYRQPTPRWMKLIYDRRHLIHRVRFARAYTSTTATFAVHKIDIGPCLIPGHEGERIRIHFAEEKPWGDVTPEEAARLDHQLKHGPCFECGATSADDPDPAHRCHCAGDKDHCHGCDLWP